MRRLKVGFGKIITVSSPNFGDQPVEICLKYDKSFAKDGINYISVLSPLAQTIYKKAEGEVFEYSSQTEKSCIKIIKIS